MNNMFKWASIFLIVFIGSIYLAKGQVDSCNNYTNNDKLYLYFEVDQLPRFEYKDKTLMGYIYENLKWPSSFDGQGTVIVSFVIKKDGNVSNIRIEKKLFDGCDNEVKRVLRMMPTWKPGKVKNKVVDIIFYIPIRFKLE